ncbi:hypothetical protein [Pedobacter sp. Leaf176]|uniref:hypothetical protein n=1 Tax=Pedobacter sp. Leaf176 TaxID=1736286 RepID=UPI0006F52D16|nr:hypothetical protein [Pedobacter sp. Leaf176]KQR65320.1 hypothetical protein ASF92_20535 [Pedobacter sp. Leaf176]
MNTSDKKEKSAKNSEPKVGSKKTVRGSGYTYTEKQERTDKSIPLSEAEEEQIVQLPNLGQKNRP